MYLYREDLDADQVRERKIEALCDMPIGAYLICQKAELPIRAQAGGYILDLDTCLCPEQHRVATDSDHPDLEKMRIRGDHVFCVVHKRKFNVRQLLDILPLGKRKTQAKKDALLATINLQFGPVRYYCFGSGKNFEMTGVSTDMKEALAEVQVSPLVPLRGVLIECFDLPRAHEILETKSDELPWRDLHEVLRSDLTLNANWHGCQLTEHEKMALKSQQLETAREKRKKRQKLVEQMRRQADALVIEPL
jgi:hypothetical protein